MSEVCALPLGIAGRMKWPLLTVCFYHVPFPWKGRGKHAVIKLRVVAVMVVMVPKNVIG